jgi:hypothetical protein
MKVIIHQPYFLPWMGYFSKMPYADYFMVLDNVSFSKGFYLDRTKYISNTGETKWLSIPIGNQTNRTINSIFVEDKFFLDKFLSTIYHSYRKADYFDNEWNKIEELINKSFKNNERLIDINLSLISEVSEMIGLKTPKLLMASEYSLQQDKTQRIIELCNGINAKSIIIGDGSSLKIHDWERIIKEGIKVEIQNFYGKHPTYKQVRRQRLKFAKGISIIDAIFNTGVQETKLMLSLSSHKPLTLNMK